MAESRTEWHGLFTARASQRLSLRDAVRSERDADPAVLRLLRMAAYIEQLGVDVLEAKARSAEGEVAVCLRHHAAEERGHVRALCAAAEQDRPLTPPFVLRQAARVFTRDRPLPEQTLTTLIVESFGIALYELLASQLGRGRAATTLQAIADDERVHLAFTAELLERLLAGMAGRRVRRLRRLRTRLVTVLVTGHLLLHHRLLGPVVGNSRADTRHAILREVERSLSAIPQLALPT